MRIYFYIIVFLVFVSCKSDDDATSSPSNKTTNIELVTGMHARASEFGPSILLGNPNIFDGAISVYPNPAIGNLRIVSNSGSISDIWMVKGDAQKSFQDTEFSSILSSDLYSSTEIENIAELSFEDLTGNNLIINLENVSFGYYRVFVKINDAIFWTNVYVGNDKDIEDLMSFWN